MDMIRSGLVTYHPALADLMVDIDSVRQHPLNANNGDTDAIAASIETNGMYRPITVQASTGHILLGNHVWEACQALGAETIPVVTVEVDDIHALRILMADNKIAALALMDPSQELANLEQIEQVDSLLGTGYVEADLEALRRLAETPLTPVDVDTPWPTICVQVSPETEQTYRSLTAAAGGDRERFEMLLRLAGG
jgi:hypothetical protein